jgi:threonine/homoserine/homoserine lactone efflux protein
MLGTTFIITGIAWCMVLAIFASSISNKLRNDNKFGVRITRTCGLVLIALGIKVALTGRK